MFQNIHGTKFSSISIEIHFQNIDTGLAYTQVAVCKLLIMIVYRNIFRLFCQLERSWHMFDKSRPREFAWNLFV